MICFDFSNPTQVVCGSGKLNELGTMPMPGKKALLPIPKGKSTKTNGSLDKTMAQLKKAGVAFVVFDKIMENPLRKIIMEGAAFARGIGCDFIVALGGGTVLDSSAAIAAMTTNPGDLQDCVHGSMGKKQSLVHTGLPIVTITTTAGTGSEINCWSVISNLGTKGEIGIGFGDTPMLGLVDPKLMKTIFATYTAYQGFDALFHTIEAMISNNGITDRDVVTQDVSEVSGRLIKESTINNGKLQ